MGKKTFAFLLIISIMLNISIKAYAINTGIICYGENIKEEDKNNIIKSLHINDYMEISFTNEEENKYIESYISMTRLTTKAVSFVFLQESDSNLGILVKSQNISYATSEMITCAMITAGIKDVKVEIISPYNISGYTIMTPIIKAYEAYKNIKIDEKNKIASNFEVVLTSDLGQKIGMQKAVQFVNILKKEVINEKMKNSQINIDSEKQNSILNKCEKQFNIKIDSEDRSDILDFINNIMNIDYRLDEMELQQKNIYNYLNDLSDTTVKSNILKDIWNKVLNTLNSIIKFLQYK